MKALQRHRILTRTVHFDTTSVSVYGEYRVDEEAPPPPFEITEGYSKDHRPDLKQFLISTLCVGDKIPYSARMKTATVPTKRSTTPS